MPVLVWVILIGFFAGSIARLIMPGPNTPRGFIVTTLVGTSGAVLASFGGELVGFYHRYMYVGAGPLGATIGSIIILYIWRRLVLWGVVSDHGLEQSEWLRSAPNLKDSNIPR